MILVALFVNMVKHRGRRGASLARREEGEYPVVFNPRATQRATMPQPECHRIYEQG